MGEVCTQVIDEISGTGEIDFVEDYAIHLPLIIIAELMGLDPDQRMKLYRWSDAMMAGDGHTEPDDPVMVAAGEAFGEYVTECVGLIEQRRSAPTDDIISILTGAYDSGDLSVEEAMAAEADAGADLSDDELLMFLTLIVAGNETTRNAVTGGLLAFSRFPAERDKLAKAELRVAFQERFRRLPDIRIPDDATPERGDSSLVISLAHLPAVFTPEHAI